jgi:hypothetical protein
MKNPRAALLDICWGWRKFLRRKGCLIVSGSGGRSKKFNFDDDCRVHKLHVGVVKDAHLKDFPKKKKHKISFNPRAQICSIITIYNVIIPRIILLRFDVRTGYNGYCPVPCHITGNELYLTIFPGWNLWNRSKFDQTTVTNKRIDIRRSEGSTDKAQQPLLIKGAGTGHV